MTLFLYHKTGEQKPAHEKQINNYKSLLAQMGYQNILQAYYTLKAESWLGFSLVELVISIGVERKEEAISLLFII